MIGMMAKRVIKKMGAGYDNRFIVTTRNDRLLSFDRFSVYHLRLLSLYLPRHEINQLMPLVSLTAHVIWPTDSS